jgi:hypothetical protein
MAAAILSGALARLSKGSSMRLRSSRLFAASLVVMTFLTACAAMSPGALAYQQGQDAARLHDWFGAATKFQAAGSYQDAQVRAADARKRADAMQKLVDGAQRGTSDDNTIGKAYADVTTMLRDCPQDPKQPGISNTFRDLCDQARKLNAQLIPGLTKLVQAGEDALQPKPGQPPKPNALTPDTLTKAEDPLRKAGTYKGSAKRADDLAALATDLDQLVGKMQSAANGKDWAGALDSAKSALSMLMSDRRISSYKFTDYNDLRASRAKLFPAALQDANTAYGERRWSDAQAILSRTLDACKDDAANGAPGDPKSCADANALLGQVKLALGQPDSGASLVDQVQIGSWKGGTWTLTGADVLPQDGHLRLTVTYTNDAQLQPAPVVDASLAGGIQQATADVAAKKSALQAAQNAQDAAQVNKAQAEASVTPAARQQSTSVVTAGRAVSNAAQDVATAQADLRQALTKLDALQRQSDAATAAQKQVAVANTQAQVQIGCADLGDDSLVYLKLQSMTGAAPASVRGTPAPAPEQRISAIKGSCKGNPDPATVAPGGSTQFTVDFALPPLQGSGAFSSAAFTLVWYGAGEAQNVTIRAR